MTNPSKFTQSFDFSAFQANQPASPLPGVQLDVQLADIEQASSEGVDAIGDVRNPDGTLKDGIVTRDSLSVDLIGQVASATTGYATSAGTARDQAVMAADTAVAARNEAVGHASNLHLVAEALAAGDYVEDYGLITDLADEVIDYGLITDPAD